MWVCLSNAIPTDLSYSVYFGFKIRKHLVVWLKIGPVDRMAVVVTNLPSFISSFELCAWPMLKMALSVLPPAAEQVCLYQACFFYSKFGCKRKENITRETQSICLSSLWRQEPQIIYLLVQLMKKYQILWVYSTFTGTDKLKDKFA